MTQYDFGTIVASTKSGTALATDLNSFRDALHSMHLGAAAPSYAVAGMLWADQLAGNYLIKMYDGTDWIPIWQLNASLNVGRVCLDADADSWLTMGADDTLQLFLATVESLRVTATGLRLGAGNASVGLDLRDKTDAVRMPTGTTGQRPTAVGGLMRWNTTLSRIEWCDGTTWHPVVPTPFESTAQTIASAGSVVVAHGLGAEPNWVQLVAQCTTAEHDYLVGERVVVNMNDNTGAATTGVFNAVLVDATNVSIRFSDQTTVFRTAHKTTGAGVALTNANWQLYVKAGL